MNMRTIGGLVLLLLGACLFLNQGEAFGPGKIFAYFWPSLFVIPLGLFFHWLYFSMIGRKAVGVLIPGGILFTAGVVCQIASLTTGGICGRASSSRLPSDCSNFIGSAIATN